MGNQRRLRGTAVSWEHVLKHSSLRRHDNWQRLLFNVPNSHLVEVKDGVVLVEEVLTKDPLNGVVTEIVGLTSLNHEPVSVIFMASHGVLALKADREGFP